MVNSIANAEHYVWGNLCDGWHLLKSDTLSVIQERMPPNTAEQYHYHHKAQQVFYILKGQATFNIDGKEVLVNAGESIHIPALTKHSISNQNSEDLSIIVISEPRAHGDRENIG
jgi:mannose-6-phosphate isomerase-like protein (cupin superfamily)